MKIFSSFNIAVWAMAVSCAGTAAEMDGLSFNRDIRPILSENCFQCHGFDKSTRKADLRLDVRESAVAPMDGKAAIVPGKPNESEILRRILSTDPDEVMPPPDSGKTLADGQVRILQQWIGQGAQYEQHWAYIPPLRPEVPNTGQFDNPIDAFISRRLDIVGLSWNPEADKHSLVRRLSFDLTGLPPKPEIVEAFERADSPSAYSELVDTFLNAPHFGERMAVYWLDLVRWADTMGFHSDDERFSTPYRDYVIESFNANLPYDQFTLEQLAGDLLENPTTRQLVASGYNRMNQVTGEGGAQPREYRAKYLADKTRNIASVWMASTLGCAECHDHKFDPFTMKDFYSMAAFFADLDEPDLVSYGRQSGIFNPAIQIDPKIDLALSELESRIAEHKKSNGDRNQLRELEKQLEQVKRQGLWTVISKQRDVPREVRILPRGNFLDETGPLVEPAVPEFLGSGQDGGRRANRYDLAQWIVHRDNPLTARVMVNRLWYLFFGNGLSGVLDDLGYQGEWPSHPDLLDWLAVEFMDSGWDIKHIVRLLVTSQTYRQSSTIHPEHLERDAGNRFYARQSRFRIQAEFIRDMALYSSGLMTGIIGGKSAKPYQPDGYWADSYKSVGVPHKYVRDTGDWLYRRGLYTFWKRTFLHPEMLTFDAPNREECVARRPISNTPLQSLMLLNDPTFVEAARVLAQNALSRDLASDAARIHFMCQQVLQRNARKQEIEVYQNLLTQHRLHFSQAPTESRELVTVGDFPINESVDTAESAAWTSVARVLLNLHEAITRP